MGYCTPPLQLRRKHANGRLMLFLPGGARGSRSRWTDGPRGLIEDKLASVFPALEIRAEADERRAEELARKRAESEEREARARVERACVERLKDEAEVWQQAELARDYVAALRARVAALDGEERERIAAWCDWIEAWADRTDPTTGITQIVGLDGERHQFEALRWNGGRGFRRSF